MQERRMFTILAIIALVAGSVFISFEVETTKKIEAVTEIMTTDDVIVSIPWCAEYESSFILTGLIVQDMEERMKNTISDSIKSRLYASVDYIINQDTLINMYLNGLNIKTDISIDTIYVNGTIELDALHMINQKIGKALIEKYNTDSEIQKMNRLKMQSQALEFALKNQLSTGEYNGIVIKNN